MAPAQPGVFQSPFSFWARWYWYYYNQIDGETVDFVSTANRAGSFRKEFLDLCLWMHPASLEEPIGECTRETKRTVNLVAVRTAFVVKGVDPIIVERKMEDAGRVFVDRLY